MADMISVLMTTYNRQKNILNALYSIVHQENVPCDYEIVIVDDGSNDGTQSVVERFKQDYPEVKINYIFNLKPENIFVNPAIAHNIGLVYAKGNIIVQSGADMIMDRDTLVKLYTALQKENALFSAALYRIEQEKVKDINILSPKTFFSSVTNLRYPDDYVKYPKGDYVNTTPFCAIYRKEWVYEIGLQDENFAMGGGEDCDFIFRMQKVTKTKWLHCTSVTHQNHPKFGGFKRDNEKYQENVKKVKKSIEGVDNRWRKRILLMGSFDYFPVPGFLWDSLKQQFLRLGHRCLFFDAAPSTGSDDEMRSIPYYKYWQEEKTKDRLIKLIGEFKPDIIISGIPVANNLLKSVQIDAFKVAFYGDMREPHYFCDQYKGLFDMMFLTNEGQIAEYESRLKIPVYPIVWGASSTAHHRYNEDKVYDVGFSGQTVAHLHSLRNELIKKLKGQFNIKVVSRNVWGTFRFYSQCKLLVSDNCDLSIRNNIKGYASNRLMNMVSCGRCVIVRYFPGLENWGKNGEHFVWFTTDEECVEKIKYYLKNEEEREKIADNAYYHFHKNFSWKVRAEYMNKLIRGNYEKNGKLVNK